MSLRLPRVLGIGLIFAGMTLGANSCGSRTGLFGPESDFLQRRDGGDAGEDLDGRVPCLPGRFTFDLALTQLMFVIDRSGSMRFTLDGRQDEPRETWRWTVLRDALRRVLPTFDQQIAMGAKFFPEPIREEDQDDSLLSCKTDQGVGIAPARGNSGPITAVFDSTEPRGGTPTSEAIRLAAQFLTQSRSVARTIVLATDGAPNCNGDLNANTCVCTSTVDCSIRPDRGRFSCLDDTRTIRTIAEISSNQRIPVYVIGIGSTERPEFLRVLDDMALAGGRPRPTTPRHFSVQSAEQMTDALTTIRDSVAKCTYLTPSAPNDPNRITVEINGGIVFRDQTHTNGWDWVDQAYGWLALFGEACRQAQLTTPRAAEVSGIVTCDDQ